MPLQAASALVAVAKEATKGTAASSGYYQLGITDGAVLSVDVQQELEDRSSALRVASAVTRTGVVSGFDFSCRAHAPSLGLFLLGALGTEAITGAADPYSHTFTTTSTDVPYLTFHGQLAGNSYQLKTSKIDTLELSWSGNGPLEVKVTGMGTSMTFTGVTFAGTSPTDDRFAGYLRPIGGTFQVATTGALAAANVTGGSIKISNNLSEQMYSGTITPGDVWVGRQEIEVQLDVVVDDLNHWRTIVTGSTSGTSESGATTYGSASVSFRDPSATTPANRELAITLPNVAFTADFPSADPAGGPVVLSLAGLAVQTSGVSGGTPITAVLKNAVAAVY